MVIIMNNLKNEIEVFLKYNNEYFIQKYNNDVYKYQDKMTFERNVNKLIINIRKDLKYENK